MSDSVAEPSLYHPYFPPSWQRASLYSLAQWVNGLAFRNIQFSVYGRPVIKIAEIKSGVSDQTKFTDQVFDESVRVRGGDMLFSWSGQPETSIDVHRWRGPEGWLNQHVFRVTPGRQCNTTFFFYLLRYLRPTFVRIARNKQTTGLGHVTRADLEHLQVAYPPLAEQRAIASILGALDDKIELNRKMSATLEAMARALFKSWFVDFDPVRAKAEGRDPGLPPEIAALFPDAFEDSELGQIPKGWDITHIGSIAIASREALNPESYPNEIFNHYSIPAFDTGRLPLKEAGAAIRSNKFLVRQGSVLVSRLNPKTPRVWRPDVGGKLRSICSTEFAVLSSRTLTREWLYCLCSSSHFSESFATMVTGTSGSHQRVRPESLMAMRVVAPSQPITEHFTGVATPVLSRATHCLNESQTLAVLRDALLPKLISGEIRVRDAERLVEQSA